MQNVHRCIRVCTCWWKLKLQLHNLSLLDTLLRRSLNSSISSWKWWKPTAFPAASWESKKERSKERKKESVCHLGFLKGAMASWCETGLKLASGRISFVTVLFLKQNVEEGDGFILWLQVWPMHYGLARRIAIVEGQCATIGHCKAQSREEL